VEDRRFYDINGGSRFNNDSFDHEIITADLNEEKVDRIVLPLFGRRDDGEVNRKRGGMSLGNLRKELG